MNILDEIIAFKRREVMARKAANPVKILENSVFFRNEMPSFITALRNPGPSVIGEYKRKSPSRGIINNNSRVEDVARSYEEAGIAAMSILTDTKYFGGENRDLQTVAAFTKMPLLRKDFIVEEYQVIESKSIGASAVLLIASVLSKEEINMLSDLATNIGLDVLFEIHDEMDLEKLSSAIKIIGVNNRDLKTFAVNTEKGKEILSVLPVDSVKVAESGIKSFNDVNELFASGYDAFLIGESFMRTKDPGESAKEFISCLRESAG